MYCRCCVCVWADFHLPTSKGVSIQTHRKEVNTIYVIHSLGIYMSYLDLLFFYKKLLYVLNNMQNDLIQLFHKNHTTRLISPISYVNKERLVLHSLILQKWGAIRTRMIYRLCTKPQSTGVQWIYTCLYILDKHPLQPSQVCRNTSLGGGWG